MRRAERRLASGLVSCSSSPATWRDGLSGKPPYLAQGRNRPRAQTKARVDTHLVLNIDLAATVLDLAGVRVPKGMHGKSLVPLLSGAPGNWRESFLYEAPTPALGGRPLMAVRTAKWTYIQTHDMKAPSRVVFEVLYDMVNDPGEMSNLTADKAHAEILRKLSDELNTHRQSLKTMD